MTGIRKQPETSRTEHEHGQEALSRGERFSRPPEREPMFMDCPAYMDQTGAVRCGLPAAVHHRYTLESTDGPLESARIRCPRGHLFNGPVESLTWDGATSPKS